MGTYGPGLSSVGSEIASNQLLSGRFLHPPENSRSLSSVLFQSRKAQEKFILREPLDSGGVSDNGGGGGAVGTIIGPCGFAFETGHAVSCVIFGEHLAMKVIQPVTNKTFKALLVYSSAICAIMSIV